jgi:sugar (glycoside-pentoside-hexuronide) transporter
MMIGVAWDAISDPLVGMWSDKAKWQSGRRRPFILAIAVPYGIATWLLFTDFNFGDGLTKVYYIAAVIIYFTCFTLLNVPHTALAAEMTQDYDERTSLVTYRALWSQVASIVGAALPLVVAESLGEMLGSTRLGWSAMAVIFGLVCIPCILLTWRATRGYELFPEKTDVGLKDTLNVLRENRSFKFILGLWSFSIVGLNVGGAVIVYFMTYYMGWDEDASSLAFLFLFSCTLLWIPVVNLIAKKWGKRMAYFIFIGMYAISVVITFFVRPGDIIFYYALLFLASGGVVSIYMLGWSMIPDVVEVDEFKTGQRREGLYFGMIAFCQKAASAVAMWLVGVVLSWVGYVPNVQQTPEALQGIRATYTLGTAIFLILAIFMAYLLPITKEKHNALQEAIALKKEGKEYDTSPFESIL